MQGLAGPPGSPRAVATGLWEGRDGRKRDGVSKRRVREEVGGQ